MSDTVRMALAAAAVVLSVGTAACGVAPSAPPPSAPAPSSPPSAPAPSTAASLTAFDGHIVCGAPVRAETSEQAGDHRELRGGAWTPTVTEISDPRLDGSYTISADSDIYGAPDSSTYTLVSETWRIETKAGAWEWAFNLVGFPDGSASTVTILLVGEGAYEGLFAVWESHYLGDAACEWDVRGVIFPAGPPRIPSPPPSAP